MKLVRASAPGKVILFGEFAVIYNKPSIAMAISLKSTCELEEINENKLLINLQNYKKSLEFSNLEELITGIPSQFNQIRYCLLYFYDNFKIDIKKLKITISSSLFPSSGLGSSASISVALIAALSEFFNLNFERQVISDLAFDMEKIVHGSPSGIDNTICTFGNMIHYQSGKFRFLTIPYDLKILVSYTNIEHNTKKAVEQVNKLKKSNPKLCGEVFDKIEKITNAAEEELSKGNLSLIGKLMNHNQNLLSTLKVSNKEISDINTLALKIGAYGSKLTGAGLGGCVITLGKESLLIRLSALLKNRGFKSFITKMDREGVKIEKKR